MTHPELHKKTFLLVLIAITAAFACVISPFASAIFWAMVLAIVFAPVHGQLLRRMPARRNLAALAALLLCLLIVIIPLFLIGLSLLKQGALLYGKIGAGDLNAGVYFTQIVSALPAWVVRILERFGLSDFAAVQAQLSAASMAGSRLIAAKAMGFGQHTFDFLVGTGIMLYLLFFLLRDGAGLADLVKNALPMSDHTKDNLFAKFTTVIRATVKGNILVAAAQGLLGGLLFWFLGIQAALLWGVLMAFLSLLPAIGAALIWGPVALYFLATGAVGTGLLIVAFGVLVIGLVDNLLRPFLVGKDTRLPDYLVLISTVGGMSLFGLSGFVIGPVVAVLFIAVWQIFGSRSVREDGS